MATDPDAELVYRAEALLEQELPSRKLTLKEAQNLVERISHAEDIDPPKVLKLPISRKYDGLAVPSERVIVVRTSRPTQLSIIHEVAHFTGGMHHGTRFRRIYLELLRRYASVNHHLILTMAFDSRTHRSDFETSMTALRGSLHCSQGTLGIEVVQTAHQTLHQPR